MRRLSQIIITQNSHIAPIGWDGLGSVFVISMALSAAMRRASGLVRVDAPGAGSSSTRTLGDRAEKMQIRFRFQGPDLFLRGSKKVFGILRNSACAWQPVLASELGIFRNALPTSQFSQPEALLTRRSRRVARLTVWTPALPSLDDARFRPNAHGVLRLLASSHLVVGRASSRNARDRHQ